MSITLSKTSRTFALSAAPAALACLLLNAPAQAQVIELDPILVEATGLDAEPIPVEQTGTAVTVVTGEELERRQIRHAGDALRSLPGLSVTRSGSFAGLTEVRIRGAESNQTMVLIDGIEANAVADGLFDFSDLSTENIERIEVLRGPQSGLYGSAALGGVINIVTRRGRGPLSLNAKTEGGSFNTRDGSAVVSGGNDALHGSLTVHKRVTDGFNIAPVGDEKDGAELASTHFKGGVSILPNLDVDVVLRNVNSKGDRDGEGGMPGQLATQVDTPSHFATRLRMAGVEAKLDTLNGALVHRFRAQENLTVREDTDIGAFGTFFSRNDSETRRLQYLSTLSKETPGLAQGRHRLTGLVEQAREDFTPVSVDGITRRRESQALALDYHGGFYDRLSVHAAIRHDRNDTLPDFTTYRVAGSLPLAPIPMRLHASAGTGIKLPTMFEQFGFIPALFMPNPDLTAEESFGWDTGAEVSLFDGRALVDVTYFQADLTDKITTVFLPGFLSTVENLPGVSTREGVEVSVRARLGPHWTFSGAYTLLDAREPDGRRELRRPRHSARADLAYLFAEGRGSVALSVIHNGQARDVAFRLPLFTPERVTLDAYTLVTLAATYEVKPGVELFGRVENLFDQDYQEVFGFETPGIAAFGGVRVRLGLVE